MTTKTHPGNSLRRWSIDDTAELYGVDAWGAGVFGINDAGHLEIVQPTGRVDVRNLVDRLVGDGVSAPLLLRFGDLLRWRIGLLNDAFAAAIEGYGYRGAYRGVYPIKVNQSRMVLDNVVRHGKPYHYGLEAGSKAELLACTALIDDPEALVVCNGYKDQAYVETALLASKLGQRVVIVVEKPTELGLVLAVAERLGIAPRLGIRMRLTSRGAGKWEQSGGDRSKFGLNASEILDAVGELEARGQLHTFELLHFHIGSQITTIRAVKNSLREASRMFTELSRLGCSGLTYFDCGGGLGVDYDGSQTAFESSMNYTVREYVNDVVDAIRSACDTAGVDHPTLVSESGRAVAAHHAVLITEVVGSTSSRGTRPIAPVADDEHNLIHELWRVHQGVSRKNLRECYHDAIEYREQSLLLFDLGHFTLPQRARAEELFWSACRRMLAIVRTLPRVPEELERLEKMLSDIYLCNFSLFQSLPDAWAVDQLFPIMPLQRLDERPTARAVLADITCDSDGTIDAFIDRRDVRNTLEVHELDDRRYYLAVMLTGAYQEILGDMHNLFGDTNTVHVSIGAEGAVVDEVVRGDRVREMLSYVGYEPETMLARMRSHAAAAVERGAMTADEAERFVGRYAEQLASYTYLS